MLYEIKNVKTFNGRDGCGFECSIYRDGKRIGRAFNAGSGGPNDFDFVGKDYAERYSSERWFDAWSEEFVLSRRAAEPDMFKFSTASEWAIDIMIDDFLETKTIKRACSKGTLFRTKDTKKGTWRVYKVKYNKQVDEFIREKHGDDLEAIANHILQNDPIAIRSYIGGAN